MDAIRMRAEHYLTKGFICPDRKNIMIFGALAFAAMTACSVAFSAGYLVGRDVGVASVEHAETRTAHRLDF